MKNWNKIVLIWGVALMGFAMSCTQDKELQGCADTNEPNSLTINVSVAGSQPSALSSRAVINGENQVDDIAVWLFNENGVCIRYYYMKASDQPISEQIKWKNGGPFGIDIKNLPPLNTISFWIFTANTVNLRNPLPKGQEHVNLPVNGIQESFTTKASSSSSPIGHPLPMGLFGPFDKDNLDISIGRAVARVNVSVTVDETYIPGLRNKLDMSKATVKLSNLVEHGIIFFQSMGAIYGAGFDCLDYVRDPDLIKYYSLVHPLGNNNVGDVFTTSPFYINQRGSYSYSYGRVDPAYAVTATLQIPYMDANGSWDEDNYYQVKLINHDASDQDSKYYIYPNRSYNLKLKIVGLGDEGILAEMVSVPWTVEDKAADVGNESLILSNEEFVTCSDVVTNELAVIVNQALGKNNGTITANPASITLSRTDIPVSATPTEIRVTMPAGVDEGTLTLSFNGNVKTVALKRKPTTDMLATLYSMPDTYDLPTGITDLKIMKGYSWLQAVGPQKLRTKSCAMGADRVASVIVNNTTLYNLIQKGIQTDFGFKDCERNVSREAERWPVKLSGGLYKADTQIKVRLVNDATKESLSSTFHGDAIVTMNKGAKEGTAMYVKNISDTGYNLSGNDGTRTVRLQLQFPNSSVWEDAVETGTMADRNSWHGDAVYGRTEFYNPVGGNEIETVYRSIREQYFEVHPKHPFYGRGKWDLPDDQEPSSPAKYLWDCSKGTNIIYGPKVKGWNYILSKNSRGNEVMLFYTKATSNLANVTSFWVPCGTYSSYTVPVIRSRRPSDYSSPIVQ